MKKSRATRWISLLLIPMLALLFMQPSPVSADAHTYSLTKTFSNPFPCNAIPSSPTFPATQSPAPGQCVAVQLAITNSSTSASTITSVTLTDTLPATLSNQGTTCVVTGNPAAAAPTAATCTFSNTGFAFSTSTANIAMNQTVSVRFVVMVAQNATCGSTIQNPAAASASGAGAVTFTGNSATASLTVQCTTPALTASKLVSVNGIAYSSTAVASPNDTLTYRVAVTNNTGAAINGVTVTDTLQPGQSLVAAVQTGLPDFSCIYTTGTRTLTCTDASIPAGQTDVLHFFTVVGTTNTTIPNTATVTSTTGPGATTNTTVVTVGSTPIISPGSVLVCGIVTAFLAPTGTVAGSITIGGLTIPIAANAVITTNVANPFVLGANTCIQVTLANGHATIIIASLNAPTVALVCGMFTTSTTVGFITVGGFPVQIVTGATFMVGLTVNVTYCFLLANGQVFAVLTGIPTSVQPLQRHGYAYRESFTRAE